MKLPYGIADFSILQKNDYFYLDRTSYIERLEALGERYLMFLRPRRFGKTLFLSMLSYYYGLEHKDQFVELFGNTTIGKSPTPEANSHHILRFDFSGIETDSEESTTRGFLNVVENGIASYLANYSSLPKKDRAPIFLKKSPAEMIRTFFQLVRKDSICLLVDEYDGAASRHFANEILAFQFDQFGRYVAKDGFVRKFYEVIKSATGEGIIQRLFITGVTPITMDSLTSGFNIASDLTLDVDFNEMLGFTREETSNLIESICHKNQEDSDSSKTIMEDLKRWYNGYRFHPKCSELVYNPNMVLYFANALNRHGNYPEKMIDPNIASDYSKLQGLFEIENVDQNYSVLKQLIEDGKVSAEVTTQYNFERGFEESDFVSLLFYLGYISIKGTEFDEWIFSIPNHVIQRLYWDYFMVLLEKQASLDFKAKDVKRCISTLAQENRIDPFLSLIEETLQALSNRDSVKFDEKYIKALFVGFANLSNLFFIKSETEVNRMYPDVMFLFRKPFQPKYQFIFELKYLPKSGSKQLESTVSAATDQLKGYLETEEIQALNHLKAWVVVFVGDKLGKAQEVLR